MVTGGLSTFGKPGKVAAKFFREAYGGVDDAAKFAVFMNERQQAKKVFDSFLLRYNKETSRVSTAVQCYKSYT